MSKFLDYNGLQHYDDKIKTNIGAVANTGVKNYLDYTLANLVSWNNHPTLMSWNNNVCTISDGTNSITFTYNNDASITVDGKGISGGAYFKLCNNLRTRLTIGTTYILSGCTTGSGSTYGIYTGNGNEWISITGPTPHTYQDNINNEIYIFVRYDVTVSELTFYPMITEQTIYQISPDYQSHYKNVISPTDIDTIWNS